MTENVLNGFLFIDSNLIIQQFTSAIKKVFQLSNDHIGCSIVEIAQKLAFPELIEKVQQAIEDLLEMNAFIK
ncbi:MAG: hypothetical protein HC906_15575 [Bacteroidales bacterium]|nr:hypothetical protein [Bacteroidales bacterium]